MKTDYDVVVVGAGPAGITAAMYLKRAKKNCLVIEKSAPGGEMNKTSIVENYPGIPEISGPDLAMKFYEQLRSLEIPYEYGEVVEIIDKQDYKIVKTTKKEITALAVIIAAGRQPKKLNKENSEELVGKGISFCSLCDGYLYKGEEVAIVGGGNSALEEALYLSEICKKVYIIHRRDELRGDKILIDRISKKENIEVLYSSEVNKFNEKDEKLESIEIKTKDELKTISAKACFIFIGYEPATNFLKTLDILDEKGYIIVNEGGRTKLHGIYAAGDVIERPAYQIVIAASSGALAAISCIKDLSV